MEILELAMRLSWIHEWLASLLVIDHITAARPIDVPESYLGR